MLHGKLWTAFGWTIHTSTNPNPRSLRNFPMQANGAEMLRLACCFAVEQGVRVCAPVHDAILIEAPLEELDMTLAATQKAMADARQHTLGGFVFAQRQKLCVIQTGTWMSVGRRCGIRYGRSIKGKQPGNNLCTVLTPPGHSATVPVHRCTPVQSYYLINNLIN